MQNWGQLLLAVAGPTSAAFEAGRLTGSLLCGLGLSAGIFRCATLLSRKETEKRCVASLLLFLTALLLSALNQSATLLWRDQPGVLQALRWVLLLPIFPLMLASLVLGMAGLIVYHSLQPRYTQGRTSAIWALVCSGLLLAGGVTTAWISWQKQLPRAVASQTAPGEAPSLSPGPVKSFEALNFRFELPGPPWVSIDPKSINPAACLILQNVRDQSFFMVVAERGGVDMTLSPGQLADISKANLNGTAEGVTIEDLEAIHRAGLEYSSFRAQGRRAGQTFHYHYQVAVHHGWFYQLIAGATRSQALADATAAAMGQRFALLDPEARCYSTGQAIQAPVVLPDLGVAAHLHRDGWTRWNTMEAFPTADFGASLGNSSSLLLFSLDLRGSDPALEDLTSAFLRVVWSTAYPGEVESVTPFEQNQLRGNQVRLQHAVKETSYDDIIWVYRHLNRAYCIITWTDRSTPDRLEPVSRVIQLMEHASVTVEEDDEKLSGPQRHLRSQFFNHLGVLQHERGDQDTALDYFRLAFAFQPANPSVVTNLANTYEALQRFAEAASFLESAAPAFDPATRLQLAGREARNWQLTGDVDQALARYQKAFASGLAQDELFWEYLQLLREHRSPGEALAALDAYGKTAATDQVLRWRAGILVDLARRDEAIALLENRLKKEPYHAGIACDLAAFCLEAPGKETQCLEICDLMEAKGAGSWEIPWLRGNAYLRLEKYFDAKTSFESALGLTQEHALMVKQGLALASAALGEGDNSLVKEEIAPVPIPAGLAKTLEAAAAPSLDSHGFQVLSSVTVIRFKKGEPEITTRYQRVKITATSGLEQFKTLRYSFSPVHERIYVNRLAVSDSSGKLLAEGEVNDYYVLDESAREMATGEKVLHVPVPGLELGAVVDCTVTKKSQAPLPECRFSRHPFFAQGPAAFLAVVLTGDAGQAAFAAPPGLTTVKGKDYRAWILHQPPMAWSEEQQPWVEDFLPFLYLGSKASSWSETGEEYLESIATLLEERDPSVEEAARRVTREAASAEEKIRALTRFVQNQLTYQAMEFGRRGRIPRPASRCLKNKYGDCKEHVLLLQQLLRAVGIPSYAALIDFKSPVVDSLPSLDQFSHVILYIPSPSGKPEDGRFIDPTDDYLPFGSLPPDGLAGRRSLLLQPGAVRLVTVPGYPAGSSRLISESKVTLNDGENLSVQGRLTASGYCGSWLRGYFANRDSASVETRLQEMLKFDGLRLNSVQCHDLDKPDLPFRMEMDFELAENCKRNPDGTFTVALPGLWERHFLDPAFLKDRKTPFEWLRPLRCTSTIELENSPVINWRALSLDGLAPTGQDEFQSWTISRKDHEGGVTLSADFERRSFRHPAERYPHYLECAEAALRLWREPFSAGSGKPGGAPSRPIRLDVGRSKYRPSPFRLGRSWEQTP